MSDDALDMGFDAVLAGEVYKAPELAAGNEQQPEPLACADATGGETEVTATATQTKDAMKALIGTLPKLDPVMLAKLARDIAMDIKETHAILKEYDLTQTQYDYLSEHNSFFKNALEAACIEWHAPMSAKERVAASAAAILEDSLPGLGARMQNRGEGLPGVIEAAKVFAKLAGVGERDHGGAPAGERFVINIDLGGDQRVTLEAGDAPTTPPAVRQSPGLQVATPTGVLGGAAQVPQEPQGEGAGLPLPKRPEGT